MVVESLTITDRAVVREARHWIRRVGHHLLCRLFDAVTVAKAAADAKKTMTDADEQNRRALTETLEGVKRELAGEVRRLFGGENPELLERLQPVLDKFGDGLETKAQSSTTALLDKVARQFDPADPTSPMAKHTAALKDQQHNLAERIEKNHAELIVKVDELATAVKISEARSSLAKVTPIKGGSFEDQAHELMGCIAAGLGEEYAPPATRSATFRATRRAVSWPSPAAALASCSR